ncbi:hypothetical protein DLJ96_18525 [Actinotalea fermentans ATCC 43279 = JCM 9966 = DSM 3133]|nr:hypothetical protein DLJ96_18525 [Actinotalea fermentans ATCC 43279 = JCM 9966 = DSM 3133]
MAPRDRSRSRRRHSPRRTSRSPPLRHHACGLPPDRHAARPRGAPTPDRPRSGALRTSDQRRPSIRRIVGRRRPSPTERPSNVGISPVTGYTVALTRAHLLRHAPSARQGAEAAAVDIAQDLLLRHLHDIGLLEQLAFKGGTALRKLYAGSAGRFSLDLDFSVRDLDGDADATFELLTESVAELELGPFRYGTKERRGKTLLLISTDLTTTNELSSKLDVNPPSWLEPIHRPWVPMPVHSQYGGPLPPLTVVRLEENVAEKIARLNRTTTARDVYDLVWLWKNYRDGGGMDFALIRRLAVLKIWVDAYGLTGPSPLHWKPGHESYPFDPEHWLRSRPEEEFDSEDIGQLSVPAPKLDELAADLVKGYGSLRDLDADEMVIAQLDATERPRVLRMLADLPGTRLSRSSVW